MATNEERREAAKKKLADRLEAEQKAERKRKVIIAGVSLVAVLAVAATISYFVVDKVRTDRFNEAHEVCEYTDSESALQKLDPEVISQVPEEQKPLAERYLQQINDGVDKQRTADKPATDQLLEGTANLTLATGEGDLNIALDRNGNPCTTGAIISLAQQGFYNGVACHQALTEETPAIWCGDPTGTGDGGPGWMGPNEPPTDLAPSDDPMAAQTGQELVTYPRGSVVVFGQQADPMNPQSQPQGSSSQLLFFTADVPLPATFAKVGQLDEAGLELLDRVIAGGVEPSVQPNPQTGEFSENDSIGKPRIPLVIENATISDETVY